MSKYGMANKKCGRERLFKGFDGALSDEIGFAGSGRVFQRLLRRTPGKTPTAAWLLAPQNSVREEFEETGRRWRGHGPWRRGKVSFDQ